MPRSIRSEAGPAKYHPGVVECCRFILFHSRLCYPLYNIVPPKNRVGYGSGRGRSAVGCVCSRRRGWGNCQIWSRLIISDCSVDTVREFLFPSWWLDRPFGVATSCSPWDHHGAVDNTVDTGGPQIPTRGDGSVDTAYSDDGKRCPNYTDRDTHPGHSSLNPPGVNTRN